MQWTSPDAFFAMGGYGLYVWGSYAVTALFMGLEVWLAVRRHRQARSDALTLASEETSS
jgi:heme exporter protein D